MPTNNHATDQATDKATNDQLAALYLRDRDTPCPSYNYNRRDGTTSTCPECGTTFELTETIASANADYKTLTRAILLFTTLITFVQSAHHFTSIVIMYFEYGTLWIYGLRLWMLFTAMSMSIWFIVAMFSSKLWLKSRKSQMLPTNLVITPVVIIFVLNIVQIIAWIMFY